MSNMYEYVKKSRQTKREFILTVLGGKCAICGYDKCSAALDAHHIDPNKKEFTIASNPNKSYEAISNELKKCVLLCANCHRALHAGAIDPVLTSSYDEEKDLASRAYYFSQKGLTPTGEAKIYHCSQCGKQVSKYSEKGLCHECYSLSTRRVERPEREELKNLIRNKPFTHIAESYGVTDNAIRKWCDFYGLPRKKAEIKQYSDEEWQAL